MLLGTAASGALYPLFSDVPWAVASVDVGFVPLMKALADVAWASITKDAGTHESVGDAVFHTVSEKQRRQFVATFVVAQAIMFACVGLALFLLGRFRLTRLANYLPYPVSAGLLAAIGVSLAKSGVAVASGGGFQHDAFAGYLWLAAAVLLAGLAKLARRRKVPGYLVTPCIVLVGCLALYAGALCVYGALDYDALRDTLSKKGAVFDWDDHSLERAALWWPLTGIQRVSLGRGIQEPADAPGVRALLQSFLDFGKAIRFDVLMECRAVYVGAVVLGALKLGIKMGSFSALFQTVEINPDAEMELMGCAMMLSAALLSAGPAFSFTGMRVSRKANVPTTGLLDSSCRFLGRGVETRV